MKKVIILSQFVGPTPYSLQQNPMRWQDLLEAVQTDPDRFRLGFDRAAVREVPEDFTPHMATTVFCEDENGMVKVWKYRWDSSG